jgi:hypothetical protein
MQDDSPGEQVQMALAGLGMPTHDHGILRGRDVPARGDVREGPQHAHEASDGIGRRDTGVATAHGASLAGRKRKMSANIVAGANRPRSCHRIPHRICRINVVRPVSQMQQTPNYLGKSMACHGL